MGVNIEALNAEAYSSMLSFFKEKQHYPSEPMLRGLQIAQETLSAMVAGMAGGKYYLCSLDPGIGKSTAIIKWLKAYLQYPSLYETEGVLISLDRLEEIERFVSESGIPDDRFSVLVGKTEEKLNALGSGSENIDKAAILFTTKQQIKLRAKGNPFINISSLHYKGKVRSVRIWDESLIVGKGLSLDRWQLGKVLSVLSGKNIGLAEGVFKVMQELESCENGSVYQMPSADISLNELLHSVQWSSREERETAETLGLMLGKSVTVRKDIKGHTLVDCVDELPDDFTPCLITDASGRIRETYKLQRQYRGDVEDITGASCAKKYNKLTVHVWRRSSGKGSYQKGGLSTTADEIVSIVNSRPAEEFLVILHKDIGLEKAIFKLLKPEDQRRVKFLTYGRHTATNEFSEIPNVIVASTLFYRVAEYEAIARASATLTTAAGVISDAEIERVRKGESAHHLLQSVCRGRVRKSEGDECPRSDLWLIAHPSTGIEALLPKVFPNCSVKQWKTRTVTLSGVGQRVYSFLEAELKSGVRELAALTVRKRCDIRDQNNFRRDILRNPAFKLKLDQLGVIIERRGNRFFFVRPDYHYYFGSSSK